MITLKSDREIEKMAESGAVLAGVHNGLKKIIKPGIDTWEIEEFADKYITDHGATPSEKGFDGYNYGTCISINNEVAHGIPRRGLKLKNGDIVKVDMCVNKDGFESDSCWSYAVGDVSPKIKKLMEVTRKGLYLGIDQAQVGNRIGDIGAAIQHYVEDENHMGDVRELIGHGIQPSIHEDPAVPAYGVAGHGMRLRPGMTITIEPMVNLGTWKIKDDYDKKDDWTYYVSQDGSYSAQYEHTLAITEDGPKILTSQDHVADAKYMFKK
ncbi:type I methionyl aminopeptidase [Fructilactobacillus fructivorans]|uniref:Methionine aminopeptidase n=1 Tax=Fructilactobacillus fructivorans TaxID=1614 RepID=A0A0C1Q2D3_9LACO|nr:type I methionyl aminopeptidase [Fructilactobacillus fructivorans]KID41973.1 Methionine aminopeptidase [Fructilactobacillus fructivorans]KRK57207.1 methionine aminopeptidase, type I [Fructilactobacillus fructivorans]MCT0151630.1 type I methionyl aminopeptidase [Fructilactobacillus fructivorans]MCT2867241.1 type I methionyl aminopeptidase [Fructilactobacillus fructivorans]MCT2868198.1 type I methionyl aminopeptidase [Fructilactobacillus fructivorans]